MFMLFVTPQNLRARIHGAANPPTPITGGDAGRPHLHHARPGAHRFDPTHNEFKVGIRPVHHVGLNQPPMQGVN